MSDSVKNDSAKPRLPRFQLDESLYNPERDEVEFLMSQTGIRDEEELKRHVLAVQKGAWDVVNYKCIRDFNFLKLKISRLPFYQDLLQLGRERKGAIFIDYACCFGNDARKAIADGYPMENVIACDLVPAFWDLGHKLFKSTAETFPVPFIQGDVFDAKHIAPSPPHYTPPTTPRPADLSTLSASGSLTPLQGHVSAIHVSAFFHLFSKQQQVAAARALASLLSPEPGSIIFGAHSSLPVSQEVTNPGGDFSVYNFSPEEWCTLWEGEVFERGGVRAEAELVENPKWRGKGSEVDAKKRRAMAWCVKRI